MEGEKLANPGPLGLAGFGMTTLILNIHNTRSFPYGFGDYGNGHLLRRNRPDHRGHPGVQERQYFRDNRFHFLWFLLAHPGLHSCRQGSARELARSSWDGIFFCGASSHSSCGSAPSAATGCSSSFSSASPSFTGCWRSANGSASRPLVMLRDGGPLLRRSRPLPCNGGGDQREQGENGPAHRPAPRSP